MSARATVPAGGQPPAAPGPHAVEWRCRKCRNLLGYLDGRWLFSRHKGREWVGVAASVRCEKCGQRTSLDECAGCR